MKRVPVLIAAVLIVLIMNSQYVLGEDDAPDKKELERINLEMSEKKKEIKRADRKQRSILAELEKIDREIQAGSAELVEQRDQLRKAEDTLKELEEYQSDISRELDGLKGIYGHRLRALYKMNRSGYGAALLTADGPGGAMKRVKYLGVIANQDRMVMREYGSALERLVAQQTEIAGKKEEILAHKRTVEDKRVELEARRRNKAGILASVKGKKTLYEQTLRELEEASASLWTMIKRDARANEVASAPVSRASRTVDTSAAGGDRPSWPLQGQVLSRFGMQRHPQFGTMIYRQGIEIEAREGEPVKAVDGGQVAYADWYKGYGKLIILDHGHGVYTLYGNLSRVDPAKGEQVSKGQVIGLVGDTGSLRGAKLYFELRRNGEAQDPLTWLAKK